MQGRQVRVVQCPCLCICIFLSQSGRSLSSSFPDEDEVQEVPRLAVFPFDFVIIFVFAFPSQFKVILLCRQVGRLVGSPAVQTFCPLWRQFGAPDSTEVLALRVLVFYYDYEMLIL